MESSKETKIIRDINTYIDKVGHSIAIILVMCTQDNSLGKDYDTFSVRTSYASDQELNDMILGFKTFVDYVDVSYGEAEFIKKLSSGHYDRIQSKYKIVYTETATGIARSKSALTPALCELYGLGFCSNDIFTAAILDNKYATLKLIQGHGFLTPKTWLYDHNTGWLSEYPNSKNLLIAKPAYECASIGVTENSVSFYSQNYASHIHSLSKNLNQPILVQELVEGYEVEVPIFDIGLPFTPGVSGISLNENENLSSTILTYDTIFEDGFDLYNFENDNYEVAVNIKAEARSIYKNLFLKGPIRIDYRINDKGEAFIIDYNNSPHLGRQHSFAFVLKELGFSYEEMLKLIVFPAVENSFNWRAKFEYP